MGLHCHQPVDNIKAVFEEAYKKSYEPFLGVLERHPRVKVSLHYSGSLLEWIAKNKPCFFDRVKTLADKSRIEILAGGYFEPILAMIPEKDARGQIRMLADSIRERFGFTPSGIWLAERVWDPSLIGIFKGLNIKYTILDDFHLKQAGKTEDEVFGHYKVKGFDDFSMFASVKKLRYAIPFRDPRVTLEFLEDLRGKPGANCVTFADDCEKFGLWPYTYDWVYKKGWLDRFFTMLEENEWIETMTFSEALEKLDSSGEAEIPHSSYAEMAGWCEGNFNNFFKKYPESDLMRKRMLCLSHKIAECDKSASAASDSGKIEKARRELYKSQSNCAYWHGVFGGIYTGFLRNGVYSHIIRAEEALEAESPQEEIGTVDIAGDGRRSVIRAKNKFLTLFIDTDYAGSIFEIDYKPLARNLVNTISRRYEPYHDKLIKKRKADIARLKEKADRDETIDLYEVLGIRERNLGRHLNYDRYLKFSGLPHFMDPGTSLSDFIRSKHAPGGADSLFGPYSHDLKSENGKLTITLKRRYSVNNGKGHSSLRLQKCIILEKSSEIFIRADLENTSAGSVKFIFGIEFNWSIEDPSFMRPRRERSVREVALSDRFSGLKVNHLFSEPVGVWSFPVYTLNETERGLGKSFQEVSLLFHRKLALAPGEEFSLETRVRISG